MIEEYLKKIIDMKELGIEESNYSFNNIKVPRVSAILSKMIHEDALMDWANKMGLAGYDYRPIQQKAFKYGTEVHNRAAVIWEGGNKAREMLEYSDGNKSFEALKKWINSYGYNDRFKVLSFENKLSCPYYGGTYDLIALLNGKRFLIDLKTSKFIGFKYFLQLAAYDYLIRYNNHCPELDGVMIVQLDKSTGNFKEYVLDFSIPEHHNFHIHNIETFLSLALGYFNLTISEQRFNNTF